MDIRSFFIKKKKSDENSTVDLVSEPGTSKNALVTTEPTVPTLATSHEFSYTQNDGESYPDLEFYINKSNLSDELKYKLLTKPYIPSNHYDFKIDSTAVQSRHFKIE